MSLSLAVTNVDRSVSLSVDTFEYTFSFSTGTAYSPDATPLIVTLGVEL